MKRSKDLRIHHQSGIGSINFIDADHDAILQRAFEVQRVCGRGLGCVNQQNSAVDHLEMTLNFCTKVACQGIYNVDLGVIVPDGCILCE